MPNIGKEEEQSRKLFVGGLSFDTTDESLRQYFEKYGLITDCVVIKCNDTGKSKGFGFVTYETEVEADKCMDERPHHVNNRKIDVKRAVSREESMKPGAHVQVKKIFIGGVKEDIDDQELKDYFGQFGKILEFEAPVDRDTLKPRGFAFITFDDFDTVDKLVARRHHEICGRRCEVKKALSKHEMEKARLQVQQKQQSRYGGRPSTYGSSARSSSSRRSAREASREYQGSSSSYGYNGYGGYGYDDGYDAYRRGYSGGSSGGPMRSSHSYRSSGPYGGCWGSSYSGGYGGYGDRYDDDYNDGYGGYGHGYGRY